MDPSLAKDGDVKTIIARGHCIYIKVSELLKEFVSSKPHWTLPPQVWFV
jgi:hypothetical protein